VQSDKSTDDSEEPIASSVGSKSEPFKVQARMKQQDLQGIPQRALCCDKIRQISSDLASCCLLAFALRS
jgi:hypothetical protein